MALVLVCIIVASFFTLLPSILTGKIIDEGLVKLDLGALVKYIVLSLAVTLGASLIVVAESYINTWIAQHTTYAMRNQMYAHAWNTQNILTHVVVPLAAIADFFVTGICGDLKRSSALCGTLPPLAYEAYAGIGYVAGWEFSEGLNYPYFFLNWGSPAGAFGFTPELTFMGCGWWIIGLFILLYLVGLAYLAVLNAMERHAMGRQ